MLSLDVDVAVVTNVELDHHATYGSLAELRDAFRELLAGAPQAVLLDRPEILALRGDGPVVAFDVPDPDLTGGGVRFVWRGHEVRLSVPGAHNALNAAAALEACALAGADAAAAAAALADFGGAGRRFQPLGHTARRRDRGRRLRPPPDRGRGHDRRGAHAGAAPASSPCSSRTCSRAPPPFAREFGAALAAADVAVRARRLPGPRARGGLPRRQRPADRPRGGRRAPAGAPCCGCPASTTPSGPCAACCAAATWCLVLGAGDVDALGRALVAA